MNLVAKNSTEVNSWDILSSSCKSDDSLLARVIYPIEVGSQLVVVDKDCYKIKWNNINQSKTQPYLQEKDRYMFFKLTLSKSYGSLNNELIDLPWSLGVASYRQIKLI